MPDRRAPTGPGAADVKDKPAGDADLHPHQRLGDGCDLQGYPGLSLLTVAGRLLPFHVRWGGDEMLTTAASVLVPLPPGGTAYIEINKNACVGHHHRAAHIFQVIPPNDYQSLPYSKPRY